MIKKMYNIFLIFKPRMVKYLSIFLFLILINSQKTINAFMTALFIDGFSQKDLEKLKIAVIVGLVSFVSISIAKYIKKVWTVELKQEMDLKIRERILRSIKRQYMNEINNLSQGDMQHRFLNNVEETTEIFFANLFNLIAPFIMIIVSFFYLVQINALIAFLVTLLSPFLGIIFEKLRLKMKKISTFLWEQEMGYRDFQQNLVDGLKIIIDYQKIEFIAKKDQKGQRNLKDHNMLVAKLVGFGYGSALSVVYFVQIAAIVIGFFEVRKGLLTVGELVALMTLTSNLVAGFSGFGRTIGDLQKSFVSAEKVLELLEKTGESNHDLIKKIIKQKEVFNIKNVKFAYKEKIILNDLNIVFKEKEKALIKGGNGQGKSTIFKIMIGLLQLKCGQVYFYGKNIEKYSPKLISNFIKWLPTDDYFFSESIRDNIFWTGNPNNHEEEKRYNLLADYFSFNLQLCNNVEINKFSGGEKQKIKLIRCFIKDVDIYLLDEPLKALDAESRIAFKHFIKDQLKDKTVIIIDHSNSFEDYVDTVYEINKGQVKMLNTVR